MLKVLIVSSIFAFSAAPVFAAASPDEIIEVSAPDLSEAAPTAPIMIGGMLSS